MKRADLSPLSKAYLEHHRYIMAGYDALGADVPGVLRAVASRVSDEDVDVGPKRLKRVWTSHAGMSLVLRLRWDKDSAWPRISLNDVKGDQPEEAKWIFDDRYFASAGLPNVDEAALVADAFAECCRLWDEAVAACDTMLSSRDWGVRERGMSLTVRLAKAVAKKLVAAGAAHKQANEVKKPRPNKTWPLHHIWKDHRQSDGQEIQWCVTFHPAYSRADRAEAPFIGLVAYPGKATNEPLEKLIESSWRYEGCAVLVDRSAQLCEVVDGELGDAEFVENAAERAVEQYLLAKPLVLGD